MERRGALPRKMTLLAAALALTVGCETGSKNAEKLALEIQKEWSHMTACEGEMRLKAEYDQASYEWVVALEGGGETGWRMTFSQPQEVDGITVSVGEDGLSIAQGEVVLDTGAVLSDGTAPAESIVTLQRLIGEGYLAAAAADTDRVTATYRQEEGGDGGVEGIVSFDSATHAPLSAELYEDGVLRVQMEFRAMSVTTDLAE